MIDFFIRRPIFAMVIAILMVFIGLLCLFALPIAQFPDIVPPQIQVNTQYIGADSKTVSDSVTTPLERSINGVHGMNFLNSSSTPDTTTDRRHSNTRSSHRASLLQPLRTPPMAHVVAGPRPRI